MDYRTDISTLLDAKPQNPAYPTGVLCSPTNMHSMETCRNGAYVRVLRHGQIRRDVTCFVVLSHLLRTASAAPSRGRCIGGPVQLTTASVASTLSMLTTQ